ncbi:hypothetical protein DVH24_000930 [Malus domestica]|uniref:Uncharacterized protein n=1 Tax=Malus domestica TaxID=3750 RepID=A0A498JZT7_MALDO|nr:hypothetical protein DVH24_000930 [Malus domestica]
MEESRNGSKDGSKGGSDDDDVGQGELYSPSHAIKVSNNKANHEPSLLLPSSMGLAVAADHIRWNLGAIKDRLLEKLAAAAVPADALDSARHFLESVVKDVTGAAHGITKDALHRMVDEAEREANNIGGGPGREDERKNEEGRQRILKGSFKVFPNAEQEKNVMSPKNSEFDFGSVVGDTKGGHADEEAQLRGDGADEGVVVEVDDVEVGVQYELRRIWADN